VRGELRVEAMDTQGRPLVDMVELVMAVAECRIRALQADLDMALVRASSCVNVNVVVYLRYSISR
jgi:hypothetical protein